MKNTKKTSTKSATSTLVRDSKGRFSSPSNSVTTLKRSSNGKFVSKSAPAVKTTIKVKSSLIKSMTINPDRTVSVVLASSPKTVYTYKAKAGQILNKALQNGLSLGRTYNQAVKGQNLEISKTIYR